MDVGALSQDDSWVLAARDDGYLGRGVARLGFRVAGVGSAVVHLLSLEQVCAVRQFVILESVLALRTAAGVVAGSGLACGPLLLACDHRDALILALIRLHFRAGSLSLIWLLLLEMRGAAALARTTAPAST